MRARAATASPPCPMCRGATRYAFTATDIETHLTPDLFPYWRCRSCGSYTQSAPPADLSRFYAAEYYAELNPGPLKEQIEGQRYRLGFLTGRSGRLVEVGPGGAGFLVAARQAGFVVTAVERDAALCRFLAGSLAIDARCSERPEEVLADLPPSDAIVMFHLIEHVPDPARLLRAAARNLVVGGELVVAAPNPRSLSFRILGASWPGVQAPRHLHLPTINSITAVLRHEGCALRAVTTVDPGARIGKEWSWSRLADRVAARAPVPVAFKPHLAHYARLASRALTAPVERRSLRGTSFTAVYVKARVG